MKSRTLFYNGVIYTQAEGIVVDSMVISNNRIAAVGRKLQHDPDFKSYTRINLRGKTVIPGFTDSHTHFYYLTKALGKVDLDGIDTIDKCLKKIKKFADSLPKSGWVAGGGYSPDRFRQRVEPDRYLLDKVTGGRPAFLFSKDQHTAWVNSRALEMAGITRRTPDPPGGKIDRQANGEPSGILRETAYQKVYNLIPPPPRSEVNRLYKKALALAYRQGVTGVHSFDGPEGFVYFSELAEGNKVGLRINYYFPVAMLPRLERSGTLWGTGTDFFRLAGIKVFADGSLGSQSALCYNKYIGSKGNYGLEVTSTRELVRILKSAARLNFPCAVHAIGDRAVANVLDAFEKGPALPFGARHRIEHLQLVRRKDVPRLKRLGVVASMQPSHCPSDIYLCRKYWGRRGANSFIFRTLIDRRISLTFGSDAPIESLNPLHGIAAAARRARPASRDVFYPDQKITAAEALFNFTVGPAIATGQEHCRGYLLPGYPADLVILSEDITKIAASRIYGTEILATVLDGRPKYLHPSLRL
ncbi:MAG: amidohydrolase [Candidatus Zixiibacteriota bacterium]|nr:MAG: amidohydrolase [candidate division Zixibacteria bacterium]